MVSEPRDRPISLIARSLVVLAAAVLTAACAAVARPDSSGHARRPGSGSAVTQVSQATQGFRFAVIGDFGAGTKGQYDVADRMCRWRRGHDFDLVITTGDNIYPDGAWRYFQDNFFTPYGCLLSNGVAFHATLGNHDVVTRNGRPELNEPAFGLTGRNYVLRRRGVRFVMVDSNNVRENWMRRKTKSDPGDRWTIVAFHHPVYSPGDHGPTPGFRAWMPRLFKRRGVDLVLNGHDHFYAVSKPLGRIRYVVTGGGGAELRGCFERWFVARCVSRHHFLYVRAGAEWLRVEAVSRRGAPFHRFRTRGRE